MQPAGWKRLDDDIEGLPVWKRGQDPILIATSDTDTLRFVAAALDQFDDMCPREFNDFLSSAQRRRVR